eukprot:TRINITY_DN1717_c0_g3_i1.p1 TRINITY_DN1717_c0_g3~~TRINITY_DN1717_c0_g3_i1.p1  ORF type:complete len:255 (-),score=57.13 TRINITY_DN1717_c0_g3_i1:233-997(-)
MKVGLDGTNKVNENEQGGGGRDLEAGHVHIDIKDEAPAPKTAVSSGCCLGVVEDDAAVKGANSEENNTQAAVSSSVVHPSDDDVYLVEVERSDDDPVGLECIVGKSDELCVTSIDAGPFHEWNMMRAKAEQIWEGDRIVEINDIKNNSAAMLAAMSYILCVKIKFRRRKEFEVRIAKCGDPLGIEIRCKKGHEGLLVISVDDGLVSEWNAANPTRQILEKDRIVEVDGIRGDPKELLKTAKASSDLTMKVVSFN